jgi:hypothetical protein
MQNKVSGASYHKMTVQMYDKNSTIRINITYTEGPLTSGWHRYILNFKWNDANGHTKMSHNGVVRIDTTNGNTRDRSGSLGHDIDLYFPAQGNADALGYVDEWNISDTPIATGRIGYGPQMNRFSSGFSR